MSFKAFSRVSRYIVVFMCFVLMLQIQGAVRDFVTLRQLKNLTNVDLVENGLHIFSKSNKNTTEETRNYLENYKIKYNMRFEPLELESRKFLFKLPCKQQVPETTTMSSSTEPSTEEPMEETTTPTTTTTTTTRKPSKPTQSTTTTMSTIMKPPIYLPSWKQILKNLWFFGSPEQINLLQSNSVATRPKSKGFLNLFEVIKFENHKCTVSLGDIRSLEGICYHEFECKSEGGIPTELCAEGVGVCCIFLNKCGDTTNQPIVYFESPNYPHPVRELMICVLIINLRKNIQQLRLDFIMFELNRPTNGDCIEDQFVISGHNINFNVPTLCGINTGQHMYVNVGDSFEEKIYLSFFAKVPNGGRAFNIKIAQLENDLAPEGCLQYYMDSENIIKSFNYDVEGIIVNNKEATYLNNLNYVVCIKRLKDMCVVSYTTEVLEPDDLDFQIVNKDEEENDMLPDGQAGAGIFNCPADFIAINQVRLCGERLNDGTENDDFTMHAMVKDVSAGPIILPFRSDSEYVGRGFRLLYKQERCV